MSGEAFAIACGACFAVAVDCKGKLCSKCAKDKAEERKAGKALAKKAYKEAAKAKKAQDKYAAEKDKAHKKLEGYIEYLKLQLAAAERRLAAL